MLYIPRVLIGSSMIIFFLSTSNPSFINASAISAVVTVPNSFLFSPTGFTIVGSTFLPKLSTSFVRIIFIKNLLIYIYLIIVTLHHSLFYRKTFENLTTYQLFLFLIRLVEI